MSIYLQIQKWSSIKMWTKTLLLFVSIAILALPAKAQISTNSWHDGYWGEWKRHTYRHPINSLPVEYEYSLYGNYSGFIIYKKGAHPSEFIFKFNTDSYSTPNNKQKKYHLKNNLWFVYSGTVEYYVTEKYPTIAAVLKAFEFPYFNCNSGSSGSPCVKRTAKAWIKIEPYKKRPKCYNIYFDDVAVAIDMEDSYFNQK